MNGVKLTEKVKLKNLNELATDLTFEEKDKFKNEIGIGTVPVIFTNDYFETL